jgi:hypothetical protein
MRRAFVFIIILRLLIAATSHSFQAQASSSGSMSSPLVSDLAPDLSAMAQKKSLSWIASIKEKYRSNVAETVEKTW